MNKLQKQNGITLIALVITIIVMLILVAVTITVAVNGGLFNYAGKAVGETQNAIDKEQQLASGKVEVDGLWYNSIDDYIAGKPVATRADFFTIDEETGELTIVEDTSENHDGIGYYYNDERKKILSEESIVIPTEVNGVEVKSIRGDERGDPSGGFLNASNVKIVVLPNTITRIANRTFYSCESLERVTMTSGVTEIGREAFKDCTSLKEIIIPNGVTKIDQEAFWRCGSLERVTIPNSVTFIGNYSFSDCSSLKEIKIPDSVTTIDYYAFEGCSSLTEVTIPSSVVNFGHGVFYGCNNLKKITISDGTDTISWRAFDGCTGLKEIIIPNSVTKIENFAFQDCRNLEEIRIPASVTSIADSIFGGCTNLTKITLEKGSTLTVPEDKWGATNATIVKE